MNWDVIRVCPAYTVFQEFVANTVGNERRD
jgi:hypothetical protein